MMRHMSASPHSVPVNPAFQSAQRAANWLLAVVLAIGGALLLLLVATMAMFAETFLPHIVEFCLRMWQALSVQSAYRLMFVGLIVLLLSLFAFFVRLAWNARATQQQVQRLLAQKARTPLRLAGMLGKLALDPHIDFVNSPQAFAFCYGGRAPRMLVSTRLVEMLDDSELLSVLAHEKYHLTERDPFKILIVRALRDAVVFLPLVRDLVENYLALQEIAADQGALEMGATRHDLASALLKLLDAPMPRDLSVSGYTPLGARVQHLAHPQRPFSLCWSWRRAAVSAACGIVILLAVFHPMVPMPLGEALHADCHYTTALDLESFSILQA